MAPYGESIASQVTTPITPRTYPDAATTTKATIATVEYRRNTVVIRSIGSRGRMTIINSSPPSHKAAPSTWSTVAITAAL